MSTTTELSILDAPAAAPARRRRLLYRAVSGLLLAATAGFIIVALRGQDWSTLGRVLRGQRPGFFAAFAVLAFGANAAGLVATMVSWRATLAGVGENVPAPAAARIFYFGQFVKYVPGKVLGLMLSVQMGRGIGVPAARMGAAWLLALVISLLTGATVGTLAGPAVLGAGAAWLLPAALPVVAVLVRPALVGTAAALVARLRRQPAVPTALSGSAIRRAVLAQLVAWLVGGVHLWLLAVAMGASPVRSLPLCVGAFGLGAVAGVLAVFAPDGIGVREVVVTAALSVTLPLPVATVVVLVSRVVVALSELTTSAAGLLVTQALRWRAATPEAGKDRARRERR